MSEYFFRADQLAFQHQTASVLKELQFRLSELSEASKASIAAFHQAVATKKEQNDKELSKRVSYRFSSAIGMIQTLKDVLKTAIPGFSWEDFSSDIYQAEMLQQLRNAVIHDGQPAVTLWADGQCYSAVNIKRSGQGKKVYDILAPAEDVETLALRYFKDLANCLNETLAKLSESEKLSGPPFPREWFEAAVKHPSLERFQLSLPPQPDRHDSEDVKPLDACQDLLRSIAAQCQARLSEISKLPTVPFR